jgi:hypothetical protein
MESNLSLQDICNKCGGYKFAPYNSNMSATVKLCYCPKKDFNEDLNKFIIDKLKDLVK